MGKRKRDSSSDGSEADKKKKKKAKKEDKKKDKKKAKKEKKKSKKKEKKAKSSSSSESGSASEAAQQQPHSDEEQPPEADDAPSPKVVSVVSMWKAPTELAPVEEGILRFEYSADEVGPLGVRLSGGNPPMVLAVNPGTFAEKKGIPMNHEVHAINGFMLVPDNQEKVMQCLKARPVVIDLRPLGWKPQAMIKNMEERREREEAVAQGRREVEERRRQQVEIEKVERGQREAAERAEQRERQAREEEEAMALAREARRLRKVQEEEWTAQLNAEPEEWRRAAKQVMDAAYGTAIQVSGRRGLPLRLVTRRKDVSWIWAGELQALIGGQVPEAFSEWTEC